MRFTLEPKNWYAVEFIGEEFTDSIRSYSPIKVLNVKSESKGSRVFTLDFYHANYPEGVRNKTYRLKTIERNKEFILASAMGHKPLRILLIYPVSAAWLKEHFSISIEDNQRVEQWLEMNA